MNANEILKSSIVVDAHFDLPLDVHYLRRAGERRVIENKYLPGLREGSVNVIVAAIYIENLFLPHMATQVALEQIDCLHQEIDESPGLFRICTRFADIEAAIANHEVAILLSLEGAEPIGESLPLLRTFYRLGVRLMGLAWSRRNACCEGSSLVGETNPYAGGLSNFGRDVAREAERLGIILDVSHLNDLGVQDLAQVTTKTLIASHSNARALYPFERNIPDDIIRIIAERGGVIGINEVNIIAAAQDADATPEMLVRHMEHIRSLVGSAHIGLGLDFFTGMHAYSPTMLPGKQTRQAYDVIPGHAALPQLVDVMLDRGWSLEDIRAVLGGNFMRLFRQNL